MQPLTQQLHGQLYEREDLTALFLDEAAPPIFLRYGLIVQGTERHIFPTLALDDWGRERKSFGLYQWLFEEGQRFPRAEVFGRDEAGRETQIFVRDLEIFFKYPCFAFDSREAPTQDGRRVNIILLSNPDVAQAPEEVAVDDSIQWPLRHAAVSWYTANRAQLPAAGWQPIT